MPRKRKCDLGEDEIEIGTYKMWLPMSWPYLPMKNQLVRECSVRLKTLKEPFTQRFMDMPDLGDDSKDSAVRLEVKNCEPSKCNDFGDFHLKVVDLEAESPQSSHKSGADGQLEPVDWISRGLKSMLTPEATPRGGDREYTYTAGNPSQPAFPYAEDKSSSSSVNSPAAPKTPAPAPALDPLRWMDEYRDLSQLLMVCLISSQFNRFGQELRRHGDEINAQDLNACVHLLLRLPDGAVHNCLWTVLDGTPASNVKLLVCSIIIQLLIENTREDSNMSVCAELFDLTRKFKLNLLDENVILINPFLQRLPLCLFLVDLYVTKGQLKAAVGIVCHEEVILQLLKDGYLWRDHFTMYGEVITKVFYAIYKKKKPSLAWKLAKVNLAQKTLPPQTRVWGSLALMTLLESEGAKTKHLARMVVKLTLMGVSVPELLQRACTVKLERAGRREASVLFNLAPVYSLSRRIVPPKGPIRRKLTLTLSDKWTTEEMHQAILWLCSSIRTRQNYVADVDLQITLQVDRELAVEEAGGPLYDLLEKSGSKKMVLNTVLSAMQRLCSTLKGMQPQLMISQLVSDNTVQIFPSSLSSYIH